MRRVVTGTDAQGRAVVVSDGPAEEMPAYQRGLSSVQVWGYDQTQKLPIDGSVPESVRYFPPLDGLRVRVQTITGERSEERPSPEEMEALLPGFITGARREPGGFHSTDTVDLVFVLEGEAVMELDDGVVTHLGTGDVLVQNGTRHAWRVAPNAGPSKILLIMLGAEPAPEASA